MSRASMTFTQLEEREVARVRNHTHVAKAAMARPSAAFPRLVDEGAYQACTFDLSVPPWEGAPGASEWIHVFRASLDEFVRRASSASDEDGGGTDAPARARAFEEDFLRVLKAYECDEAVSCAPDWCPKPLPTLDCVWLCRLRERALRVHGFEDVFRDVKASQNDEACRMLPALLRRLDQMQDERVQMERLVRGLLAGNTFDLGANASARAFQDGESTSGSVESFFETCEALPDRPWMVDDVDAYLQAWCDEAAWRRDHRKAVVFVDNAGADAVLGALPFARQLAKRGMDVVLAANRSPSINDITASELETTLADARKNDEFLRNVGEKVRVVECGNELPVIDLKDVSMQLASEAEDADLVVLLGMGRAVETNLHVELDCDCLRVARVKHKEVAQLLGGELFGCVVKWTRATESSKRRSGS